MHTIVNIKNNVYDEKIVSFLKNPYCYNPKNMFVHVGTHMNAMFSCVKLGKFHICLLPTCIIMFIVVLYGVFFKLIDLCGSYYLQWSYVEFNSKLIDNVRIQHGCRT